MNALLNKNNAESSPLVPYTKAKPSIQPKLTINTPGDIYEQEADDMADIVMRVPTNEKQAKSITGLIGASVQRKIVNEKAIVNKYNSAVDMVQNPKAGRTASNFLLSSLNASKPGGTPLPDRTQNFMENAFSTDFSAVRIHTDKRAAEMNNEIQSRAFTLGNDIYFNNGEYTPHNAKGKELLAHELTHVVQQGKNLNFKKIQRVLPAVITGLGAAEWIALGASGYLVAGDAINSGSGDISYTFDEMEGVLLPNGGSDIAAYRGQNPSRRIFEGTHYLAIWYGLSWWRKMGIKFGITFMYDGMALGNISLSIIDTYDSPGWGGNVNVNITPRSLSSGISSVRFTINVGTSNSWFVPDWTGSKIFTLRADSDLRDITRTRGPYNKIG